MFRTFFLAISLFSFAASAALPEASYYRVWKGYKKTDMTQETFLSLLAPFMVTTIRLYGPAVALNQYIVVVPPKNKPDFVPDEFALIALKDEASYRAVRETAEGKQYGESHWELFDKNTSMSAKALVEYQKEQPAALDPANAYSMFPAQFDWNKGYTTIYLGVRKAGVPKEEFLKKLQDHMELASELMAPMGMQGYFVHPGEEYELAYINWSNKEEHDKAFVSEDGQRVMNHSKEFMNTLMYEGITSKIGEPAEHGKVYRW